MDTEIEGASMLAKRLEIANQMWANNHDGWLKQISANVILVDTLKRAHSAIVKAITHEDGLDGQEGEIILEVIRQVLAANDVEID